MKSQRGLAVQSYSVPWINDTWEKMCDDLLSTGNKLTLLSLNLKKNVAGACRREKHGLVVTGSHLRGMASFFLSPSFFLIVVKLLGMSSYTGGCTVVHH